MRKLIYICLMILVGMGHTAAQQASVTAQAPANVQEGQRFAYTLQGNAKFTGVQLPQTPAFKLIGGPSTQMSTSIQTINGRTQQTTIFAYTYYFEATKKGKYTIPGAKVTMNGNTYTTNQVTINVGQGKQNNANQQGGQQGGQTEDFFVRMIPSRTTLYQGEHLTVTLKLYSRVSLVDLDKIELPDFQGFWQQEIPTGQRINLQRENINGQVYETGVVRQILLFPQRSGQIQIEPFELTAIAQVRARNQNPFSPFGMVRQIKVKDQTPPLTINVKALPGGAPESFKGATGQMEMSVRTDRTEVKANEAISLKVQIKGQGNLKTIEAPDVKLPADFETYDPEVSTNMQNTLAGQHGSKTFEYLLIPRHGGEYSIPPIEFSYFDPKSGTYKTIRSEEIELKVAKGDGSSGDVVSGFSKEDVIMLGEDIRYLKDKDYLQRKSGYIYGSSTFWGIYGGSLLAFLLVFFIYRKRVKENANLALVRNRRASKASRKRLRKASLAMKKGENEQFYDELLQALWGYLGDKFNIPLSDLNKDMAMEKLKDTKLSEENLEELRLLVEDCEFARYAPGASGTDMQTVYARAATMINKLEKKL